LNIEDALINQVSRIQTQDSSDRDRTPLSIDRKVFHGIFGNVTWHACWKVQAHYDSMQKPLKPCTGVFSGVTGLPCAHLYDEKRNTTGFTSSDFHPHWFWDRKSIQLPYLDPLTVQSSRQDLKRARNTGRILSDFERVEQAERRRAPPKCTACQAIGHTRASRNCPLKLRASIAEDTRQLREHELSQASNILNTPRPSKRTRLETPDTPRTTVSEFFTPLTLRNQPKNTENRTNVAPNTIFDNPPSPSPIFRVPTLPPGMVIPPDQSPTQSQLSLQPEIQSDTVPTPPLPLCHERPEMAMIEYQKEKEKWLTAHPHIESKDYRKARGFEKLQNLRRWRWQLPTERRQPNGEIIEQNTTWSEEEIFAWQWYQDELQEREYEEQLNTDRHQLNRESATRAYQRISKEVSELQSQFTF
jgi:hypothetical protein